MSTTALTAAEGPGLAAVLPGTPNFLAKYVNAADVGNSAVYETPIPQSPDGSGRDRHHHALRPAASAVHQPGRPDHGAGGAELSNTATSYSGMLFYDQFGALASVPGL